MAAHRHARVQFTPKVAETILQRIAEGESLMRICGPDRARGLPDRLTVHKHLREDKGFRLAYLVAREVQAETLAGEIIAIADGLHGEDGKEPNVGRDWLRVSARQWLAGVMAPRTYGRLSRLRDEVAELEAQDAAGREMSTAERAAKIVAILEAVRMRTEEEGVGEE